MSDQQEEDGQNPPSWSLIKTEERLQQRAAKLDWPPIASNPLRAPAEPSSPGTPSLLVAHPPEATPIAVTESEPDAVPGDNGRGTLSAVANFSAPAGEPVADQPDSTRLAVAMAPARLVYPSGSNDLRTNDRGPVGSAEYWTNYLLGVTAGLLLLILMLILTVWRLVAKIPTTSPVMLASPHESNESARTLSMPDGAPSSDACRSRTPVVDLASEPVSSIPELAALFHGAMESEEEQKQNQQTSILQTIMEDNLQLQDDLLRLETC